MNYSCPNCSFGSLKPIKITYVRRWGPSFITVPNFSAWRCDSCNYTRYDAAALTRLELILGPDIDDWSEAYFQRPQPSEGPGERGPRRWPS